jgi:hypothetical protein
MEKMFNEGNQIHNFMSGSGSGYGSGSTSQKVTVPTVPVPQHCEKYIKILYILVVNSFSAF